MNHTTKEIKNIAKKNGGKCLSERYINSFRKKFPKVRPKWLMSNKNRYWSGSVKMGTFGRQLQIIY